MLSTILGLALKSSAAVSCREGRQGQHSDLSTKIPNDSPGLALLTRHFVIAVATVGSFAYQHVPTRMSGRLAVHGGRYPVNWKQPILGGILAEGSRATQERMGPHEGPWAARHVISGGGCRWHTPHLPASGDIRASLFHGEEQIAAFDATKPAGRQSFGARPAPSARWAACDSSG